MRVGVSVGVHVGVGVGAGVSVGVGVRDLQFVPGQPPWAEGVLVIHDLAGRQMYQAPGDGGEGRGIGRRAGVIHDPATILREANGPAARDRFPEELWSVRLSTL